MIVLVENMKIALIEESQLYREGIKLILTSGDYNESQIYEFAKYENFIAKNPENYDIVLINIQSLLAHKQEIKHRINQFNMKVIALSEEEDRSLITKVVKIGVKGFISGATNDELLLQAIDYVKNGQSYIDFSCVDYLIADYQKLAAAKKQQPIATVPEHILTKREYDVLHLLSQGLSNKTIANQLMISEKTINNHVGSLLKKLNVGNRTEAVILALRNNWIAL